MIRNLIKHLVANYINENAEFQKILLNKNFWRWFGKSKIMINGKPLICYHGTNSNKIDSFDLNRIGQNKGNLGHYGYGIYFSTDIREARTYGDNIYKCFLKIENPFFGNDMQILQLKKKGVQNIDDLVVKSIDFQSLKNCFRKDIDVFKFIETFEKFGESKAWEEINKIRDSKNIDLDKLNDISNIIEYTTLNKNAYAVPNYVLEELKLLGIKPKLNMGFEFDQAMHWITDLGNKSKEVTDVIKSLGYDGVWYGSEIVVFNENQIKSIKNEGSWSESNNNIFF